MFYGYENETAVVTLDGVDYTPYDALSVYDGASITITDVAGEVESTASSSAA